MKWGVGMAIFVPDCKNLSVAQMFRITETKRKCGSDSDEPGADGKPGHWGGDADSPWSGPPQIVDMVGPGDKVAGKGYLDDPGAADIDRIARAEGLKKWHRKTEFMTWVCCDGKLIDSFFWESHFELEFECSGEFSRKKTKQVGGGSMRDIKADDSALFYFSLIFGKKPDEWCK